jgi:hypothetical protein
MKLKKANEVKALRVLSYILPLTKLEKKTHMEIDFEIDRCSKKCTQYTIDHLGYFSKEVWKLNPNSNQYELIDLKRTNITRQLKLETEILGKPAKFIFEIKNGKVISIERLKLDGM